MAISYEVFEDLKGALQEYNIESVAEVAECSPTTLYNWLSGFTTKPRIDTLVKVAEAVGYDVELKLVKSEVTAKLYAVK